MVSAGLDSLSDMGGDEEHDVTCDTDGDDVEEHLLARAAEAAESGGGVGWLESGE